MSIKVSTLPSGLTVISDPVPDVESCSLGLWFGVGTRHEMPAHAGLSHLLEHMFFKGSVTRDAKTLNRTIENVGGSLNAYTTRDQTAYTGRVLAADLDLATDLLADMLLHPRLDPSDLEKEKQVVAQEIGEAYDAPDDWIFDLLHLTAFPDQPLGQPVLGSPETLAGITQETLRRYIATHYRAHRAVFTAAGAVDHDRLMELARQRLGDLPGGDPVNCVPARYAGGDALEARDIEQLHLCYALEAVPASHPLFHAQTLFALALGGGTSSRLFQEVREERALAYSISAYTTPYQDSGLLLVYAAADPGRAQEAGTLILHETAGLATTLSEEELARAKALARASLLMELESTGARTERAAHNWLTHGRIIPVTETIAGLERVTLADIRTIAALLLRSPLTRTAVGPVEALEPFAATQARLAA